MGVRMNWLAVEGGDRASLLAEMGLAESGVASDELNSPLACAEFLGGWFVLVSNDGGVDLDQALPLASQYGLAVGCELEEHVMFSRLRAFRGGARAWSVTHDPDVDADGVSVEGEPPPPFEDLRAALAAEQAESGEDEVDHMFDLPVRLGQQICGYAHDEPRPVVWTILERAGRRRATEPDRGLADAFHSEIFPRLASEGWSFAAEDPDFSGRAWAVTRLINGRRELLRLFWRQDGPQLEFETKVVVFDGDKWTDKALFSGEALPRRAAGGAPGRSLWRRIADHFSGDAPEKPAPPDPLAQLVSRVKEDLAAIDDCLTSGAENPRVRIRPGGSYFI